MKQKASQPFSQLATLRNTSRARWLTALMVVTAFAACFWGQDFIQNHWALPVQFALRDIIGKSPALDPSIKIYAYGDSSLSYSGKEELTLKDWARIFARLEKEKPRAIIVDKMFSSPPEPKSELEFQKTVQKLSTKLIVGAFVSPTQLLYRQSLPPNKLSYLADFNIPVQGGHPYGPHTKLVRAFSHIGHFDFSHSPYLTPLFRMGPRAYLPAATLLTADHFETKNEALWVNHVRVPLSSKGNILVNFVDPKQIERSLFSFTNLLKASTDPSQELSVPSNPVIVLLSSMYSGNSQMVDSPYGLIPSGNVTIAMVNSVLKGDWLNQPRWGFLLLFLMSLVGVATGIGAQGRYFIAAVLTGVLVTTAGGLALFCYRHVDLPWLPALFAYLFGSILTYLCRVYEEGKSVTQLKQAFEGSLPPQLLEHLVHNPTTKWLEPKSRVVTVGFIDIVGFSLVSEKLSPSEVFSELKSLLGDFTEIIHRHGGIVDKTLGDGLVCFFGIEEQDLLGESELIGNHAERAVRCLAEIQLKNAETSKKNAQRNAPVLPLRIGLNTASVVVGNLGNSHRIDLTLIGHGVNMAKRMESAAEPFSIMIGASTRALVADPEKLGVKIIRRWIAVKHFKELTEAYEVDPFVSQRPLLKEAMEAYRHYAGIKRLGERVTIENNKLQADVTGVGTGGVVDISENGIGLNLPRYLGKGVILELSVTSPNRFLAKQIAALEVNPLVCEVKWGMELSPDCYFHGLRVQNVPVDKMRKILTIVKPTGKEASRRKKKAA